MRILAVIGVALLAACQSTADIIGSGPVPDTPRIKQCIEEYMSINGMALALKVDGSGCGWYFCRDVSCRQGGDAMVKAKGWCERDGGECRVYAYGKEVIWETSTAGGRAGSGGNPLAFTDLTSEAELSMFVGRFMEELDGSSERLALRRDGSFSDKTEDGAGIGDWRMTGGTLCFKAVSGSVRDDVDGCYQASANDTLDRFRLTDGSGTVRTFKVQ